MDENLSPDWFLQDWMSHLDKIQASLTKELGWNKSKANLVYNGKQKYNRDTVNELASWLGIEPFELLMRPADALEMRQLREAAVAIAARVAGVAKPTAA